MNSLKRAFSSLTQDAVSFVMECLAILALAALGYKLGHRYEAHMLIPPAPRLCELTGAVLFPYLLLVAWRDDALTKTTRNQKLLARTITLVAAVALIYYPIPWWVSFIAVNDWALMLFLFYAFCIPGIVHAWTISAVESGWGQDSASIPTRGAAARTITSSTLPPTPSSYRPFPSFGSFSRWKQTFARPLWVAAGTSLVLLVFGALQPELRSKAAPPRGGAAYRYEQQNPPISGRIECVPQGATSGTFTFDLKDDAGQWSLLGDYRYEKSSKLLSLSYTDAKAKESSVQQALQAANVGREDTYYIEGDTASCRGTCSLPGTFFSPQGTPLFSE